MSKRGTSSTPEHDLGLPPFSQSLGPAIPVTRTMSLDDADTAVADDTSSSISSPKGSAPLSIEQRYDVERMAAKRNHWHESPYAVGLVERTWSEHLQNSNPCEYPSTDDNDSMDSNACGCVYMSALVCSKLGADRVGNMAVLKQTQEWVEEVEKDEETGEETTRRFTRPRLQCMVGPFWPMLVCATYPLIIGVSGWTALTAIPGKHPALVGAWICCTLGLLLSLTMVSCTDPGILIKVTNQPPSSGSSWRWSDRAQSFRPKGAHFDSDCAVVVEEFDHT